MDVTLDYDESFKTSDLSRMDDTQDLDTSEVTTDPPAKTDKEVIEDEEEREEEGEEEGEKSDSDQVDEEPEEKEEEEEKEETEEKEEEVEKSDSEPGEEKQRNGDDTVELTSNQFENELLGLPEPKGEDKEKKEIKVEKPKIKEEPVVPKKVAPPPKIHRRDYTLPETPPDRPRIRWTCGIVKQLVSIELLSGMIEINLKKEEEPVRKRASRSTTEAPQPARKQIKKEEEDLDFEESENDSPGEQEIDQAARDPTAFPAPPAEPAGRSRKEENRALLIANLIRPFTVLQLKTMLSQCGKVKSIWINTIKSRCYVVFASVDEAHRAREALHGAVWPSTSPKTLSVDFAEDERMYSETDGELIGDSIDIQVIEEQKRKKPKKEKEAKETKKLDDLFKKTAAVPSIYWLPLTDAEAKERAEERAKGKPRYFVPEPEMETEYAKPRAIPRWKTPERTRRR